MPVVSSTKEKNLLAKSTTLLSATGVRCLLICHNALSVWRVVLTRGDVRCWWMVLGNTLIIAEGVIVVKRNGGTEWKWWCPCFLLYLLTTLPLLWLLQLHQYETEIVSSNNTENSECQKFDLATTTSPVHNSTETNLIFETIQDLLELEDRIWIVILQETLVYLIVFARWVLPRVDLSRMALSDLLLDYFGKASDIMELYALFDEDAVRTNLTVTYIILATWSISFLQFVPVLVHKHKYRHLHNVRLRCISPAFTDNFPEVFDTCMTFFLQDGPFLCLRLYVMLELDLLTYSLVFFVLKNIFTLILLVYRFTILCCRSPYRSCGICRNKTNKQLSDNNCVNEIDENELKEKERQTNVPDQIFYFD